MQWLRTGLRTILGPSASFIPQSLKKSCTKYSTYPNGLFRVVTAHSCWFALYYDLPNRPQNQFITTMVFYIHSIKKSLYATFKGFTQVQELYTQETVSYRVPTTQLNTAPRGWGTCNSAR